MLTLDANIFVRTIHPNQPEYANCQGLLDALGTRGVPVFEPLIILAEVAGAVRRETGDPVRARIFADTLGATTQIQFTPVDIRLAREALELAADYALRGMDAIYVAVARQHGCALVTLDDEPRRRAAAVITTYTPAEALTVISRLPPV